MSSAEPERFFCTAGRGMEPFLAREVRARLGATEVDCVSGKVFFRAAAGPGELRQLRSGERLFLLLKKHSPLPVSGNRGKMLHEIKSLVIEDPKYWLDIISVWRKLHGHEGKTEDGSQENTLALKRKSEEETNTASKRQKTEQVRAVVSEECQVGAGETCEAPDRMSKQECWTESRTSSELPSRGSGEGPAANDEFGLSFRVSCRCSGAIARILTSQEVGRAIGMALVKQCGWHADLRDPDLEIFVHLNDIHSVVGIPLFRLPLANREYIRTAGLRSTVAWAMASLAEIRCLWTVCHACDECAVTCSSARCQLLLNRADNPCTDTSLSVVPISVCSPLVIFPPECLLRAVCSEAIGAFHYIPLPAGALVLDPMCGLGTILLEAAKEWPEACYWGADISDSQLEGADGNIRTAGLVDKIELLKASVKALPLPSESFDSIISDIPFGKKFKTTSDAQLLPALLQETERVLRVGGTLVLLLSQELHRRVDGLTRCAGGGCAEASADGDSKGAPAQAMDGLTRCPGGDPAEACADGDSGAAPNVDGNSSSLAHGGGEPVLSRHFGSLLPEGVYAVSLGKTDAFIHKYRKVSAAGSSRTAARNCPSTGTLPGTGSCLALA
ncbi:THUMP domain-containing protein 2 isoform X2 [Motacilla alba alba]|uniref:THUMP domain-containing protein 2 isoform X2 n=1 Tax=Motacilla alba alba TaxID=1094192 RepID=UPI0018D52EB4|nr:THUMP domain-containing protein 2 isoform X2 [Motacilla alba alba]XP_037984628.1 THUMP domain-containing protein 2 isoform X2 [Motacilla alba alba]